MESMESMESMEGDAKIQSMESMESMEGYDPFPMHAKIPSMIDHKECKDQAASGSARQSNNEGSQARPGGCVRESTRVPRRSAVRRRARQSSLANRKSSRARHTEVPSAGPSPCHPFTPSPLHRVSPPSSRSLAPTLSPSSAWLRRPYENAALATFRSTRTFVLFWARQCRKSTTLGAMAFDEMARQRGRHVIAASASLLVGSELVNKSARTLDQASLVLREASALQTAMAASLAQSDSSFRLVAADSRTGKEYANLSPDDFAGLYRACRLELRLYFSKSTYSRLQVIAPNPATARGWTGTVFRDEAAFTPAALELELQEAVAPIIDADPTFRLVYASNLPSDDHHPFFELTFPSPDLEFPPDRNGHFYHSANGTLIHRVSLADAYAAGHVLYDQHTSKPLSLEQYYKTHSRNQGALCRNYQLIHQFGGVAAIDYVALDAAQRRGLEQSLLITTDSEADFQRGLQFLRDHLQGGPVGVGFDVATTTRQTSNPSSLTVTEQRGPDHVQLLVLLWKERQPEVVRERLRQILETIAHRPQGGPARRLCIDATNERYFAQETARAFHYHTTTLLVISSVTLTPFSYAHPITHKTYLGDLYTTSFNDNRYTVPADSYFKTDHRLVIKERGTYHCEPTPDGMHGDTFDSAKLAHWALHYVAEGCISDESAKYITTSETHERRRQLQNRPPGLF